MKVLEISITIFGRDNEPLETEYVYTNLPEDSLDRGIIKNLYQLDKYKTLADARFIWLISKRINVVIA